MGTTLLSIIGSLIVFLLGILWYLMQNLKKELDELKSHVDESLESAKNQIIERVHKPDCIRDMQEIRMDLKEAVRDIRELERRKGA